MRFAGVVVVKFVDSFWERFRLIECKMSNMSVWFNGGGTVEEQFKTY